MTTLFDLRRERGKYWSQSRLGAYMLCSLKFAFSYIYRAEPEHTAAALPFGNAVHRTLEMMARTQHDGHAMSADDLAALFRTIWSRQLAEPGPPVRYREGDDAESLGDLGETIVRVFRDNVNEEERVISVSEALAVPIPGLNDPLIGEMDLVVESADGRKIIVDWKTAARRWPKGKADTEIQPTALVHAFLQHYGETPVFEYRIATKTKQPAYQSVRTNRTKAACKRLLHLIRAIDHAVKSEAFLPSDGCFACKDCQFGSACKAWHTKNATHISVAA